MKGPEEFYNAQEHQLNKQLLNKVRAVLAEYMAGDRNPDREVLRDTLKRAGFEVPVLWCEGVDRNGEDCGLRRYHDGLCRF